MRNIWREKIYTAWICLQDVNCTFIFVTYSQTNGFAGICRYVCMKSLEHTGQIENLMSRKSKHIVWHGRQEGEAPHYCFTCEVCLLTNRF